MGVAGVSVLLRTEMAKGLAEKCEVSMELTVPHVGGICNLNGRCEFTPATILGSKSVMK
jgi:hypothetical protein